MTTQDGVFPSNDQQTPLIDEVVEEPESEETTKPGDMRTKLSEQAKRIRELEAEKEEQAGSFRARSMTQAFQAIGLDPLHGVGKAVAVTFDGEAEDLREFAEEEFGHVYAPDHPFADRINDGHARLDKVSQTAGSISQLTQDDELAKAEAKGDYATTLRLKGAQIEHMFQGKR